MGAFLEKPKTEKTTDQGEGRGLRYGVAAMQGWRMEMEDAHVCNTSFALKNYGFFGVFDGHAGPKVSQFCAQNLLTLILENITETSVDNVKEGIHKGFLGIDEKLKELPQWASGEDRSGTTAIVVMVSPDKIIWANCGDSRGLLCRNGKVEFATVDHKPYNTDEKARIEKAGGTVMMQRVNGSLAVSRALGDFDYKRANELPATEQLVSPEPEITDIERDHDNDQFLFLACDGIFDVMSNEEVIAYVLHRLEITDDLAKICSDLIDMCLNKNSRDNMSVVLVTFPSAPKVSKDAIEKEEKLQKEALAAIEDKLKAKVAEANEPLDLEENYVIQQLTQELQENYDVVSKRPYISERLQVLKKEKFKNETDFSGPSDPSEAPQDFLREYEGKAEDGPNPDDIPVNLPGDHPSPPKMESPSPKQAELPEKMDESDSQKDSLKSAGEEQVKL